MTAVFYHLRQMGAVMLLGLPVWLVARNLWLAAHKKSPRWGREAALCLFGLYLAGLISQTLTMEQGIADWAQVVQRWQQGYGINLTPLATIRAMLEYGGTGQKLINLAGNVLIFVPLGALPPLLWRRWRHLWAAVLLSLGASCAIECAQLFVGRSVDVDDVLLNLLGGVTGYLLARLMLAIRGLFQKT